MKTALYAAILGLMQVSLTSYVVFGRWRYGVSLGDGGERDMRRRVRAHGNFTEIVPMSLILLYLAEQSVLSQQVMWIHVFGGAIVLGRVLHVVGMTRQRSVNRLRQTGMVLNLGVLSILPLWLLYGLRDQILP